MARGPPRRSGGDSRRDHTVPERPALAAEPPSALGSTDTPETAAEETPLSPIEAETFAVWRAEIDAEIAKHPNPPPAPSPEAEARKSVRSGLLLGAVALLLAFLVLPYVAALPAGLLLLDAALAYGLLSFLRILLKWKGLNPTNGFIAAMVPSLALGALIRFLAATNEWNLPLGLRYTLAPTVLVVALASTVWVLLSARSGPASNRRLNPSALVGWSLFGLDVLFFIGILSGAPAAQRGTWATLAWTFSTVAIALLIQGNLYKVNRWEKARRYASAPALALAATQLLDGAVSYLAVGNPFGFLATPATEQMPISAFLIQWTGPGYVLVKWVLALVLVAVLDRQDTRSRIDDPIQRAMIYLIIAYVGMGPAVYSTIRLFV